MRLATVHGLDETRLRIAALGHDLVRHEPAASLIALAREHGLEPDDVEVSTPILLHGPIAARILESEYGYDRDVLNAVACHTTARPGMVGLELALFVADKIEPEKLDRQPGWAVVEELSRQDLHAAALAFLDLHIAHAVREGWLIHPRTVDARNWLLLR